MSSLLGCWINTVQLYMEVLNYVLLLHIILSSYFLLLLSLLGTNENGNEYHNSKKKILWCCNMFQSNSLVKVNTYNRNIKLLMTVGFKLSFVVFPMSNTSIKPQKYIPTWYERRDILGLPPIPPPAKIINCVLTHNFKWESILGRGTLKYFAF